MAVKKMRVKQRNAEGTYDTLYPETTADQVLVPAGGTIDDHTKKAATTAQAGHVQLSSLTNSPSDTLAATPLAVKTVQDSVTTHAALSASTSAKGHVQLIDSAASASLVLAPTANALKVVNDAVATHAATSASVTVKGHVQLVDSAANASLVLAPTANALKVVNDAVTAHIAKAATTAQVGHVQLVDSVASASVTLAPTANAVKVVNDALTTHAAKAATTAQAGHVQLSNSIAGTSQTLAATEKALNDAKVAAIDFTKGFGLGGPAKQVTGNWNDYIVSGLYMGSGLLNEPPGGHVWKFVTVLQHNDAYVIQTAVDFDNTMKFTRALQNGVWSQWFSDGLKDGGFRGGAINFNDLTYFRNKVVQIGDTTGSNYPPPMAYGVLVTHNPSNSGYATQSFTTVTTGDTFTRGTSDGGITWTAWAAQSGVVKGSYVGNRAANRVIPMGFTPKLVIVTVVADNTSHVAHGTSAIFHISGFHTQFRRQAGAVFMPPGGVVDGGILLQVDNDGLYLNYDGTTMYWTAFK